MEKNYSYPVKVAIVFGVMFAMLALSQATTLVLQRLFGMSATAMVILGSVFQNVLGFILTAILCARFFSKQRLWHALRYDKAPSWFALIMAIVIYFTSIPLMNFLVDWNSRLILPDSMKGLEQVMRRLEDAAQAMTTGLLQGNSFMQMTGMVLVVGVLTAIGEETIFRGSLLGLSLDRPMNRHVAIIVTAIVFSAFHFQFFGFFPRMLLGVWLGYLMLWTRSIWVPIVAHAFNNGMVVVMTWLEEQGAVNLDSFNTLGVSNPLVLGGSIVLTAVGVFLQYRHGRVEE